MCVERLETDSLPNVNEMTPRKLFNFIYTYWFQPIFPTNKTNHTF